MGEARNEADRPVASPLAERVLSGEIRAAARLMRWLDDEDPRAIRALKDLYPHTGRAHIIGITGNPGSGKSTLTDRLITQYRAAGNRVGVIAVDPSSPYSGGAILGDRIRMQAHATDPDVFIRSLATRGHLGGLSRSTNDVVHVMDAMGYDVILVETVGVGQDEVDIVGTAHTSVVVVVPGLGDEIQAIKAGILEIADVFAVNKADRPGADQAVRHLKQMHSLSSEMPAWTPEIIETVALRNEGVPELVDAIDRFHAERRDDGTLTERVRARERQLLLQLLQDRAMRSFRKSLAVDGALERHVDALLARESDPYSVVEELLGQLLVPPAEESAT